MNGKYTIHGSKIDEIINQELKVIVDEIVRDLPEVISILLTGGFGRGEGSIKIIDGKVIPLKDFDFLLFFDNNIPFSRINKLGKRLREKFATHNSCDLYPYNSFTIDLNATTLDRCNMLPDITTYEAKVASHALFGKDIRDKINIKSENIPLRSGARILFQKGISLIGQFSTTYIENRNIPDDRKEMFVYECAKVFVELGTSLSILAGEYKPSYEERGLLFENKYKEIFPELYEKIPDLGEKIAYFTKFKLNPDSIQIEDPISLWFSAREYHAEVFKYYMSKYLDIGEDNDFNAFLFSVREHLKLEYYKSLIAHVLERKFSIYSKGKILNVFNTIFQIYGNINYIRNLSNFEKYSFSFKPIDYCCPTINFYYATLLILHSIEIDGYIKINNLNLAEKALRTIPKSVNDKNNLWENTREIYLNCLHILPYIY